MRRLTFALACLMAALLPSPDASAAPKAADLVQASLVTGGEGVAAGRPFTVGVRLKMAPHWHTYWRNPGDSGLATEIAWHLPDGFKAGPIQWPAPHRIEVASLVNYGFDGEVTLLAEITPPPAQPSGPVTLAAKVSYLVCERECIPGEANLSTTLAPGSGGEGASPDGLASARSALPVASPWPSRLTGMDDRLQLKLDAPGLKADAIKSAYFFPYDETAIEHAAPQTVSVDPDGLTVTMQRSNLATSLPPKALAGVLAIDEDLGSGVSRQAFAIGDDSVAAGASPPAPVASAAQAPAAPVGLGLALGLALLGGLVLNLMPCVFPVLSIKVMSLVRHAGSGPATVRLNGLAYAAGVVISFLALAGVLLALRHAGAQVGWGFQLQSPAVVLALALLMLAVGLSLSGVVEFGTSVAALAGRQDHGTGLAGSFGTGVLACAVATPCTAPFMGAAIGYAVTASAASALAVFATLGVGMALPFLVLTLWPALLARMPRPGAWMDVLKQVLAFPVYATVAWLVFVLSQQVGPAGLFAALLSLVVVGFGAWCWRLATTREGLGRRIGQGAALASLFVLIAAGCNVAQDAVGQDGGRVAVAAPGEVGAPEPFSQARLDALRAEGRPVFVNMTAAWCITCLVNERTALSTAAVKAKLRDGNVAYLKGDWTNQNPEITRVLEQHGRSGVPLYLLFPPKGDATVLPQILTAGAVIESLDGLPVATKRADLQPK